MAISYDLMWFSVHAMLVALVYARGKLWPEDAAYCWLEEEGGRWLSLRWARPGKLAARDWFSRAVL
jgi:hypothetical protein